MRQTKLKKQIRKLLAKKNNSQIARKIGCSHGYVGISEPSTISKVLIGSPTAF
ncbi:MAG: hypothetical protein HY035_03600 [Nitrospirae bacterium]|nr:hypothetical protein [Nitrospirota bacterium]